MTSIFSTADDYSDNKYEWALKALEVLASMRAFHDIVNKQEDKDELYIAARIFVQQLVPMSCIAFMEVDDIDKSFVIANCEPLDRKNHLQEIIDKTIDEGKFSWALQQNKIVTIPLESEDCTLAMHSLTTVVGMRGMFVGILDCDINRTHGIGLDMVSVVIQNLAASLDTYFSKELINNYREHLEVVIKYRTRELEEAKKMAEGANLSKSNFLANLSHELNTPFNIIFGYLDLLMEDIEMSKPEDPRQLMKDDLLKISFASRNLHKMVGNIIYLSKLEAGRIKADASNFFMDEVLLSLSETYAPLIEKNKNVINLNVFNKQVSIYGDQQLITHAVEHLLDNACKFTESGSIMIALESKIVNSQPMVSISIEDTGIGIAEEGLKILYNSFTQVDGSSQKVYDGLGLGLTITHRLCELLEATLSVESTPGKGSKFTIVFPV